MSKSCSNAYEDCSFLGPFFNGTKGVLGYRFRATFFQNTTILLALQKVNF